MSGDAIPDAVPVALASRQCRNGLPEPLAPRPMLSGHVSPDDLPGVLEFLKLGRKTGVLAIDSASFSGGFIAFVYGQVVHARAGTFDGQDAFARLLATASGVFDFYQGERQQGESREMPRTLTAPLGHLLMEAVVWRDHHARELAEEAAALAQAPHVEDAPPMPERPEPPERSRAPLVPASSPTGALMDEAFTVAVRAHVTALAPTRVEAVLSAALRAAQAEDGRVTKTNAPAFLREVYARLPGEVRAEFMRVIPSLTSKYAAPRPP